jgi:hypothetical protein
MFGLPEMDAATAWKTGTCALLTRSFAVRASQSWLSKLVPALSFTALAGCASRA